MKRTLIAGAIMTLVSTGAFAGKPVQPPSDDLTPRVAALEDEVVELNGAVVSLDAANQEQNGRITAVEDALGYTQPDGRKSLVLVDASDKVVGTLASIDEEYDGQITVASVFVQFEGNDNAYRMGFRGAWQRPYNPNNVSLLARRFIAYTDQSCGLDGGEAYYDMDGTDVWLAPAVAVTQTGQFMIPDPNATMSNKTLILSAWMPDNSGGGTCDTTVHPAPYTVPAIPVTINVQMPVHLEYR